MSLARPQDPRALLRGSGPPYPLPTRLLSHSACRAGAGTQGPLPPAPKPGVAGAGGRRARCGLPRRGSLLVAAALGNGGSYEPYPWDEREYHRVALQMVQTSGPLGVGVQSGYFLLMRVTEDDAIEDTERALVMSVGGDTLAGVAQLAQGQPSGASGGRPLSLDLLWQVLQRGQEISRRTWGILRVAVVELRGNTFLGRVFFGDLATGTVAWDCDCRPSDACWLALKSKAPIYIHQQVWEDSAMLLREIQRTAESQRQAEAQLREKTQEMVRLAGQMDADMAGASAGEVSPQAIMTTPRPADPEPLKRLKMEMRVALKDEDYAAAARIRDHPWMRLHLSCLKARQRGDEDEAERCERQLQAAISRHELEEERQQAQRQREAGGGGGGGGWGGGGGGPGLPFY